MWPGPLGVVDFYIIDFSSKANLSAQVASRNNKRED